MANTSLKGTRRSEALLKLLGNIFTVSGSSAYWPARPLALRYASTMDRSWIEIDLMK